MGPLERKNVDSGPRLVLIFDGLDEIARPGETADDIARDMMSWVRELYNELKGDTGRLHRILITGRMPSFQAARKSMNIMGRKAIEVLDLLPINETMFSAAEGEKELIQSDQRPLWWARYSSALGRNAKPPSGLAEPRLESLTAEPLLCYLLALSGYLEQGSLEAAENRNRIYARLIHDVWRRAWGGEGVDTSKFLSEEHFNRLFETMALAAWHGGDERVATHERFEQALKVTRSRGIWEEFTKQGGGNESNLAVNFYLKRAEKEARGFEFTHKSFGEYLTARALLRTAIATAELSEQGTEYALTKWLDAVGEGELSHELLNFLRDETRLLPTNVLQAKLRALEKLMSEVVSEGFPAHKLKCETWRSAEERQRKAETLLMALVHCLSCALATTNEQDAVVRIHWQNPLAFGDMLHRIRRNRRFSIHLPVTDLFSRLDLSRVALIACDLIQIDLSAAYLTDANLILSCLLRANLCGANLKRALLVAANLERANLKGADLRGADLEEANLEGANLEGANLEGANLKGANLEGANLEGAKLEGAKLEGANLEGAK